MKMKIFNSQKTRLLFLVTIILIASKNSIAQNGFSSNGANTTTIPILVHDIGTIQNPNAVYVGHGGGTSNGSSTAVGYEALKNATGAGNSAFGSSVMPNVTGIWNAGFGSNALNSNAGGNYNSAFGINSLKLNTSGSYNSAFGTQAMFSNIGGDYNVAVGHQSLYANTAGYNVALGCLALPVNTTGNNNVAVGYQVLYSNVSGIRNVGIGNHSLNSSTADSNTAAGYYALAYTTTGAANVGIGTGSLGFSTTGKRNVAVGANCLNLATGNYNVGIGYNASVQTNANDYQLSIQNVIYGSNMSSAANGYIGIGTYPALITAGTYNNTFPKLNIGGSLRIGRVDVGTATGEYLFVDAQGMVNKATLAAGVASYCGTVNRVPVTSNTNGSMTCSQIFDNGVSVGINQFAGFGFTTGIATTITPNPAPANFALAVNGWVSGIGFTSTSDQRLKKNIKRIENSIDKILQINGYTYNWNKDFKTERNLDNNRQAGFLAQEIEKVLPEAVVKSEDGIYGLNYNAVLPLLAEGIKEQQKTINELKLELAELRTKLNQSNNFSQPQNTLEYFQIQPNPIEQESKIVFKLDNTTTKAIFIVYDLQGKMIKKIDLPQGIKEGKVDLSKKDLGKGMYILSLIVNNNEVQSKRFLVL